MGERPLLEKIDQAWSGTGVHGRLEQSREGTHLPEKLKAATF